MITHGNKQISEIVYARKSSEGGGAVRLTNIIRGAQVVFGGLSPSPSSKWLTGATMAAILAAFGQDDGYAVIGATNAYLNALAATDQTKATALAGFINEDPMLVCSLGIQPQGVTMPIRGIVTDGSAWLDTGWVANGGMKAKIGAKILSNKSYYFGSHNTSSQGGTNGYNRNQFYIPNIGKNNARFNVLGKTGNDISNKIEWAKYNNIECSSIQGHGHLVVNDTEIQFTFDGTLAPLNTVALFYYYYEPNINVCDGDGCSFIELWDKDSNKVREMYPFIRQGAKGMLDILSGTFYPNANTSGSFSIAYTLPDGTPWTPLNQTP